MKKKKPLRTLITVVIVAVAAWCAMFAIDWYRCSNLNKPIFVTPGENVDSSGTGTFQGILYTVDIESHYVTDYSKSSASASYVIDSTAMHLFGILVTEARAS